MPNIFTDSASPAAGLSEINTARSNGFRLDPGHGFFLTDSSDRLVPDNSDPLIRLEITFAPYLDAPAPVDWRGTLLRNEGAYAEWRTPFFTDGSSAVLERLASITNARPQGFIMDPSGGFFLTDDGMRLVPDPRHGQSHLEIVMGFRFDWPIPFEDFVTLFSDTPGRYEVLNPVTVDTFSLFDIAIQIVNLLGIPVEWKGSLADDTPTGTEHLTAQRRDTPVQNEHTFDVRQSPVVPVERLSAERRDMPVLAEHLTGERRDATSSNEHTVGVTVSSPADPVEHTSDVKPLAPVPLEKTFMVKPLFAVPLQFGAKLQITTTTFPVEFRGVMLVDSKFQVERLLGVRSSAVPPVERLAGIARDTPVRDDQKGSVARNTPEAAEHLSAERADAAVPLAIGLGMGGRGVSVPHDHLGTLRVDRAAGLEFRTWLARVTPGLTDHLALIRQNSTAGLEHVGTVAGLTPSRVAYSATLRADRTVPAKFTSAIAAAVAVLVERVGAVQRADAISRVEWRGAMRVDVPMRADHLAKLQADGASRIEITMQVHRDSGIPVAFYGYALVPQTALQASKIAVQLEGSKVAVDLEGSKVQILLVGEIK